MMASPAIKGPRDAPGANNRLPHLIKWIKHRVTPRKDDKLHNKSVASVDGDTSFANDTGLCSVSKDTLLSTDSSLLDTTLGSSTTSFSGNTIVSDSSLEANRDANKDKVTAGFNRVQSNPSVLDNSRVDRLNSVSSLDNGNITMGVMQNVHQTTPSGSVTMVDVGGVCKHGMMSNRCRACMRLPPLPPGSERVLRELQRQAKQRLRSQSQVQFGSTGNISANVKLGEPLQPHTTESMNQRHSMHLGHIQQWQSAALQKQQLKQQQQQHRGMIHSQTVPRNMHGTQFIDTQHSGVMHNQPRLQATSPEHVYEEIPEFFFKKGNHFLQQRQQHAGGKSHPNNCDVTDNNKAIHVTKLMGKSNIQGAKKEFFVPPDVTAVNALKSHEFYPQNMHSSPASQAKDASSSRQVSLGNLDFGMAKECDGFLVVPLRDRKPGHQKGQPVQNTDHRKNWIQSQSYNDNAPVNSQANGDIANVNVHRQIPVLAKSASAIHIQFHAQTTNAVDSVEQEQRASNVSSSHLFKPIYAHARTQSVDAVNGSSTERYSHCDKCGRPHGVYHGVSLCHTEMDDVTHELQYLDIAGLERKKKSNHTPTVLDSPSLLQNFARRRSAFAKYIPKTNSHSANKAENPEEFNKGEGHIDAYKRQSMSAESDYFSTSNYNTSQSDTFSRTSREHPSQQVNYMTSSDRSNDTFSEYDMATEVHHKKEDSVGSTEYKFYLEKVKQNLKIKQEVQRIIRSSESERSDCERSDKNHLQEDTISLTSVTSLSELSTMPFEESHTSFVRLRTYHKTAAKGSPKQSKHAHTSKTTVEKPEAENYVSKMQRVRKPIRKKRKSPKDVEYYKLPNFTTKPSADMNRRSDASSYSLSNEYNLPSNIYSDGAGSPSDKHDSSSCYSTESNKSSEKLSCRVTDFRLSDIRRNNSVNNKHLSVRAMPGDLCDQASGRPSNSLYYTPNAVKHNSNNKLLSDLMKMNHDRQLFQFI